MFDSFINAHWDALAANPVAYISLIVLTLSTGFVAGIALSRRQISILREKVDFLQIQLGKTSTNSLPDIPQIMEEQFHFPSNGFHGINVLNNEISSVLAGAQYSFHAIVPKNKTLRIKLRATISDSLLSSKGAWVFGIDKLNWQSKMYDFELSEQWFHADSGKCDLRITFQRACVVIVDGFENDSRQPTWSKDLLIKSNESL